MAASRWEVAAWAATAFQGFAVAIAGLWAARNFRLFRRRIERLGVAVEATAENGWVVVDLDIENLGLVPVRIVPDQTLLAYEFTESADDPAWSAFDADTVYGEPDVLEPGATHRWHRTVPTPSALQARGLVRVAAYVTYERRQWTWSITEWPRRPWFGVLRNWTAMTDTVITE